MGGATGFLWLRLRHQRTSAELAHQALKQAWEPKITPHGLGVWGAFAGHFGLDTRELVFIVNHPRRGYDLPGVLADLPNSGVEVVEEINLIPTARPSNTLPLSRAGLYVHRLFEIEASHADEFVQLSAAGWQTLENSDRYASEPMGLFRESTSTRALIRMVLVTWYDSFASWQESRNFPPGAAVNFQRRAELTLGTIAYATRLLPVEAG